MDDRLTEQDHTVDSLLDTAEAIAEEMAEEHFEKRYSDGICAHCLEDTPLAKGWARDIPDAKKVEALANRTEIELEKLGEDDPYWVESHLCGHYHGHYYEQTDDPEDCAVCTGVIVADDDPCGHERHGERCPVDD